MRVEWRNERGWMHLVGGTELGWMLGNDSNLALLVLYGLGRREAGKGVGGFDLLRKALVRVGEEGGESSSSRRSSSSSSSNNGDTTPPAKTPKPKPPPKAPKKKPRHFESSEEEPPPAS